MAVILMGIVAVVCVCVRNLRRVAGTLASSGKLPTECTPPRNHRPPESHCPPMHAGFLRWPTQAPASVKIQVGMSSHPATSTWYHFAWGYSWGMEPTAIASMQK